MNYLLSKKEITLNGSKFILEQTFFRREAETILAASTITKTRLFKYINNFTTKKKEIFR